MASSQTALRVSPVTHRDFKVSASLMLRTFRRRYLSPTTSLMNCPLNTSAPFAPRFGSKKKRSTKCGGRFGKKFLPREVEVLIEPGRLPRVNVLFGSDPKLKTFSRVGSCNTADTV